MNKKCSIVFYLGCCIIIWITRGRRAQLSCTPPTWFRESVWTMAKRWGACWTRAVSGVFVYITSSVGLILCWIHSCVTQSHKVSVVKEDQLEGVRLFLCIQAASSHTISAVNSDSSSIVDPERFDANWLRTSFSADKKSKMSLVVSVHVYSVQKASLKDSGPLYSVDYDAVKDNLKDCSRFANLCHPHTLLNSCYCQFATTCI